MAVRNKITETDGVYFITITCARWMPLFEMTNGYDVVYKWFNYLKQQGHFIVGYVIMPNHIHAVIAFKQSGKSINTIVANGKRFMAYELIGLLQQQNKVNVLQQLSSWVNATDRKRNKQHEVFEPSFDRKECITDKFVEQKLNYIHQNSCRYKILLATVPQEYVHSSAKYYITGEQGIYEVTGYLQLHDIDLTSYSQSP